MMGTLMYMSPEQVRDSKHIDHKTDLYSLAVTFVHLLTGKAPYDRDTTDDFEIRNHIVNIPLEMDGVPRVWQNFLRPYLAKNPADRPALTEFCAAAAMPQATVVIPASEKTVVGGTMVAATRVVADEATVAETPSTQPRSRKVWPWVVAALAAVVVIILLPRNATKDNERAKEEKGSKVANENSDPGTVKDQDGNEYKTVKIGNQVWMAENMRAEHDRDGNAIAIALGSKTKPSYDTPYRYCPDNYSGNVQPYGYLYNWVAAKRVCPVGWHLPSDAEWTQLTDYLKNNGYSCGNSTDNIAKALASQTGWENSSDQCDVGNNPSANNATGFSALPAGYYNGRPDDFGYDAGFWSATESSGSNAWCRGLIYCDANVGRYSDYKSTGGAVRCVRD
jgi:uncharacterized protein (TIGR02145 family)